MSDTLYFTTEMPTESFDELTPAETVAIKRAPGKLGGHTDSAIMLDPAEEMECRIALLEVAFQNHALEIRDRMAARLSQLEEKLACQNSELRDALREETGERQEAIQNLSNSIANAIDRVEKAALVEA